MAALFKDRAGVTLNFPELPQWSAFCLWIVFAVTYAECERDYRTVWKKRSHGCFMLLSALWFQLISCERLA